MARVGADVAAVDELALELERFAARIDGSRSTVDAQLARTRWHGPDADAFRAAWRRSALSDLEALRQDLSAAASELRRQAADQRAASADGRDRSAWAAIAAIGGVVAASIGIVIGAVTGASSPTSASRSSGGLRVTNAPGAAGMRVVSSSQLQGSSPHLQGSSPHLQGSGIQVQGAGTPGSQRLAEGSSSGASLGGMLGFLGAGFREWFETIVEGSSASNDGALSASPGIPDGQPGAAQGRLPERSPAQATDAYARNGPRLVGDTWQPDGTSGYQCTAWANFRWAELLGVPQSNSEHGAFIAGGVGGTAETVPTLGAMVSYPSENHVVIVEGIRPGEGGSQVLTVSELNWGLSPEQVNERKLTRLSDGSWLDHRGRPLDGVVVANLPL